MPRLPFVAYLGLTAFLVGCESVAVPVSASSQTFKGALETPWGRQVFEFRKIDETAALLDGDQMVPLNRIDPIDDEQTAVKSALAIALPGQDRAGLRWPFRVPYTFSSGFNKRAEVQSAINEISRKTQLTFVQRTTEADYIEFISVAPPGVGANVGGVSFLGRVGGKQTLYLNPCASCSNASTAAHEIGHALGFLHEHIRPDRDAHVVVADPSDSVNNGIWPATEILTPYDQISVMHYPEPLVRARNGTPVGGYHYFDMTGSTLTPQDARGWNTAYPHHCRITLPSCSIATELYRKFIDTDPTSTTPQGCFARALQWADSCQVPAAQAVRGEFFNYGTLVAWTSATRSSVTPVVTVAGPSVISLVNVGSLQLTGDCSPGSGPVTLTAGAATTSAVCQLNMPSTQGAQWTYRYSATLDTRSVPDAQSLVVRVSQRNGGGEGVAQWTLIKDTQPPGQLFVNSPGENDSLKAKRPMLRGAVEPGATIIATLGSLDGGAGLCSTTATASGDWSCAVSRDLTEGLNEISVAGRDGYGNTSAAVVRRVFIDTVAPAAPEIRTPLAGSRNGPRVAFTGLGEAGARVTVREQANVMCSTDVAMDRTWSCMSSALSLGTHQVVVRQTDRAANDSVDSPPVTFSVDQLPEVQLAVLADISARRAGSVAVSGACSVTSVPVEVALEGLRVVSPCMGNAFQAVFDVTSLVDGELVVTARQVSASGTGEDRRTVRKDVKAPEGTTIEVPVAGSSLRAVEVISGTTEPNATVALRLPNGTVSVVADNSGRWQAASLPRFVEGLVSIVVMAQDALGNEGPEVSSSVTIDSLPPAAPRFDQSSVFVESPFTVKGMAEPLVKVSVRLNGEVACEVEASAAGTFACPISIALRSGSRQVVTAVATDAAQNQSEESTPFEFSVRAGAAIGGCSTTGGGAGAVLGTMAWLVGRVSARRRRCRLEMTV